MIISKAIELSERCKLEREPSWLYLVGPQQLSVEILEKYDDEILCQSATELSHFIIRGAIFFLTC